MLAWDILRGESFRRLAFGPGDLGDFGPGDLGPGDFPAVFIGDDGMTPISTSDIPASSPPDLLHRLLGVSTCTGTALQRRLGFESMCC